MDNKELYDATTKAFDVFKALRDSRPYNDTERMAAWDAYKAARAAWELATDKAKLWRKIE